MIIQGYEKVGIRYVITKERMLLMVCSRCRIPQFCSRQCQVAGWPVHEKECGDNVCQSVSSVSAHKQQTVGSGNT